MNYIITKNPDFFRKILSVSILLGKIGFCGLEDMVLPHEIAIDTETTGLQPRNCDIFCTQIGTGENNYIIHMYDDNYEFQDLIPYIDGKILVGHNILFDLGFFYKYDFWPKEVRDTMLASKILYNGDPRERHDFGHVMKREMDITYDKTEQKNIHLVKLSQPSTIEYSFNDVDRLLDLHNVLYAKLDKRGSLATYELHYRYVRALAYMEQCGMPISSDLWKAKMEDDVRDSYKFKEEIEDYIHDNLPKFANNQLSLFETGLKKITVSVSSPAQMLKVFNAFGIPTIDKDGKDSINENVISKSKHEFVEKWLKFQVANHRVTTFGESIYKKIENERIYTNFNPMVDTARLSTRRGEINFLNFPADKATRGCFKSRPGWKMIVCDYSGQETVIVADLSGDAAMTKSVVEGADLHSLLARVLFPELEELTDNEIKKNHNDKRTAAKAPRFAMSYGGNAFTIHMNEGIPLQRAQEIEDGFKNLHAGLYAWGEKVFQSAIKVGYIESVDGWRLRLPFYDEFIEMKAKVDAITKDDWMEYKIGKNDYKKRFDEMEKGRDYEYQFPESVAIYREKKVFVSKYFKLRSEYFRLCLNNPVQTRGAHQIKLAGCYLFDWIIENNYQWKVLMCNSVHDELVAEAIDELAEKARIAVEQSMLKAGNHYLTNLTIKADADIGPSWGEAKK
jgi:DNA polymerase I-like protein with 3'-5' exonuclease and polymerase domains